MAKKETSWTGFVVLGLIIVSLFLIFTQHASIQNNMVEETRLVLRDLGEETTRKVMTMADDWYRAGVIETHLDDFLLSIVPTEEQRLRSRGMEDLGHQVWPWVDASVNAFLDMTYWLMRRIALLMVWLPVCLPAMVLAIWHGLLERKIKQTNFGYASPILHRYAWRGVAGLVTVFSLLMVTPWVLPPVVFPLFIGAVILMMGMSIGHMVKRF